MTSNNGHFGFWLMFMLGLAASLVMTYCGCTGYGEQGPDGLCYQNGARYQNSDVNQVLNDWDEGLAAAGLTKPGEAIESVKELTAFVTWYPLPFECHLPYSSNELVYGCTDLSNVEVGYSDCLAETALTHELTHMLHSFKSPLNDPDYNHTDTKWWDAVIAADAVSKDKICGR